MRWCRLIGFVTVAAILLVPVATTRSQEPDETAKKSDQERKKTKVAEKTEKVAPMDEDAVSESADAADTEAVTLEGTFEAVKTTEVVLRPKQWTQLSVHTAVSHGRRVKKGDRLVTLDSEKIDQEIHDIEEGRQLSLLAFKQAEHDLEILEGTVPIDLAASKRKKEAAEEDLKRYYDVDRPQSEKQAKFSVKSSEDYLSYAREELRQLEQMYKADDLTEESEEIILKRQRDTVERAEFSLEQSRIQLDRTLDITLPRQERSLKESALKTALDAEKAQTTLPMSLRKAKLELEKLKYEQAKSAEKLSRLRQDRKMMEVTAPADGIVYYGQCTRGKWSNISGMESKLRRGGSLSPNEVFITIVAPRPLIVRATVDEKDLAHLRVGTTATAIPVAMPSIELEAKVQAISSVPIGDKKFDVKFEVDLGEKYRRIVPGMACDLKLSPPATEKD